MTFLILVALASLLFYWRGILSYFRLLHFAFKTPTTPGSLPLIGHLHNLRNTSNYELFEYFCKLSKDLNKGDERITKVWLGPYPVFFVTDSREYKKIANTCLDKNYMYKYMEPFFQNGILLASASLWKQRIKLIQPSFGQKQILNFIDVYNDQARQLVKSIRGHVGRGRFSIRKLISDASINLIFKTAFGLSLEGANVSTEDYSKFMHHGQECLINRIRNPFLSLDFFYNHSGLRKEVDNVVEVLHKVSTRVVKESKEAYLKRGKEVSDDKFRPFLELLLQNSANGVLSDDDMRAELDAIITTGFETITITATYALILLGIHLESQDKVYRELKEIYGDSDRDVTKEDMSEMPYLEAVLKETLRLYPLVPFTGRVLDRDMPYKQYTLPANSTIFVSHWATNRQSCWGDDDDVEQFKPERWFDLDNLPSKILQDSSFGIGLRSCPGRFYAMTAMKTMLAQILCQYKITARTEDLESNYVMILQPGHESKVNVELRSGTSPATE